MSKVKYQELYIGYHQSSNQEERNKYVEKLHITIYQYIHRQFSTSLWDGGDFYLDIQHKIEFFMEKYDSSYNITFDVFIYSSLKILYLKWSKKQIKKSTLLPINANPINDEWVSTQSEHINTHVKDKMLQTKNLLHSMKHCGIEDTIMLYLHCGLYLHIEHIHFLFTRHQEKGKLLLLYKQYIKYTQAKKEREMSTKSNIQDKLDTIHARLEGVEKWHYGTQLVEKRQYLKSRKEKLIQQYNHVCMYIPLFVIAQITNRTQVYVHRHLKKIKSHLKDTL